MRPVYREPPPLGQRGSKRDAQPGRRRAERGRMRALRLVLALLVLVAGARTAAADSPLDRFAFLNTPPPALPSLPPAPERAPTEWARRSWEIVARAGLALPWCSQGAFAPCSGFGVEGTASLAGLYRITPYVGLGAEIGGAGFRLDEGSGRAGIVGAIFRAYY